jgi:hypothetical protein
MRINENVIAAFIGGTVVGSIITYFYTYLDLTREQRLISRIRNQISERGCYLDLSGAQRRKVENSAATADLVSDDGILEVYRWARRLKSELKLPPEALTADTIIFQELLGLTSADAVAMMKDKNVKYLSDTAAYVKKLQAEKSSSEAAATARS